VTNQYAVGEEEVTSGSKNTEQTHDARGKFDALQIQKNVSYNIAYLGEVFMLLCIIG